MVELFEPGFLVTCLHSSPQASPLLPFVVTISAGLLATSSMDSLNVILLILKALVLLEPNLMRELVVPRVWKHRRICSTADSNLLFTMDFEGFFTMDFLLNSLNLILGELVRPKLNLVWELKVPRFQDG